MARARSLPWTAVLLAVAGLGIVPFGLRAVRLERDEDAVRTREALVWGARRAVRDAEEPESPPEEAWTLEATPAEAPEAPSDDALLLEQARFLARQGDEAGAAAIEARLAEREGDAPTTLLAALRAGAAAARRGDDALAERHLARALGAPEDLRDDESGLPVALLAAYHRAGPGDAAAVDDFLRAAGDGRRLGAADGLGPDDLVLSLDRIAGEGATAALRTAAQRARRGARARAALPSDGVAVVEGRVHLRRGERIESRPLDALVAAPDAPPGVAFRFEPADGPSPDPGRAADLGPPLRGLRLVATPTRSERSAPLLFGAAFAVYLLGAVLAVVAIRRTERAARMQADFVSAVSHEMKTPIASVRAMAELLADGVADDPERARRYAERIEREMRRLGASVRNVLDAARIERTEEIPLAKQDAEPLAVVTDAVAAQLPALEGRGFRVVTEGTPLGERVALDADALHGVLANLLDNAAKYSGASREIRVEAGPAESGAAYRIAVLDRGIGVPPEERGRLFARFYRGEAARRAAIPGVGLGLHVAREVVRAHGGDLTVETRDGGGSAFVVRLPAGRPS